MLIPYNEYSLYLITSSCLVDLSEKINVLINFNSETCFCMLYFCLIYY